MSAFEAWVKEYMCKPKVERCQISVKAGWRNAFEAGAKSTETANKQLKIERDRYRQAIIDCLGDITGTDVKVLMNAIGKHRFKNGL